MSALPSPPASPSAARWNPATVLDLSWLRCNGITTKGAQCKYGPSAHGDAQGSLDDCKYVSGLVDQLRKLHPTIAAKKEDLLLELASAMMCIKYHQGQAPGVVRRWTGLLQAEGRRMGPVSADEANAAENSDAANGAEVARLVKELDKMRLYTESLKTALDTQQEEVASAHEDAREKSRLIQQAQKLAQQAAEKVEQSEQHVKEMEERTAQAEERSRRAEQRVKQKEAEVDMRQIRLEQEEAHMATRRSRVDESTAAIDKAQRQLDSERKRIEVDRMWVANERTKIDDERTRVDDERTKINLRRDRLEEQRETLEEQRSNLESQRSSLSPPRNIAAEKSPSRWRRMILRSRKSTASESEEVTMNLPEVPRTSPGRELEDYGPPPRLVFEPAN